MPKAKTVKAKAAQRPAAKSYDFKDEQVLRPDVGLQAQFRQKKPPAKYRYDPSLDPQLSWDVNADRERAERLIQEIADAGEALAKGDQAAGERARAAAVQLRKFSRPFLNWTGKAENEELEVPTLPLFVHERLSTEAILKSVEGRKPQKTLLQFFADPELDVTDRVLKAYSHKGRWTNRIALGDSLVVMNSLLRYEGLGGQVQMVYIDPPYGVKFGSNFQPFVKKNKVEHGRDDAFTREPEMVQAYRDTWELGLHSYLTYMRDRLILARELLSATGSVFVQISDENIHHVRELLDEVFGAENFCKIIAFRKTAGDTSVILPNMCDYLLWYARDITRVKYRPLFLPKDLGIGAGEQYDRLESPDRKEHRKMTRDERDDPRIIPQGWKPYRVADLKRDGYSPSATFSIDFDGQTYHPGPTKQWKTNKAGIERLASAGWLEPVAGTLMYRRYLEHFPVTGMANLWADTATGFYGDSRVYVVQTNSVVVRRCLLMTTDPGDLVLDPTCGSGTTAYVAEQWGRRWITIDTSRVPLALARQRLLTATFPYYDLRDEKVGPAGGFIYKRKQNKRGDETGGLVPHVTLKSIAQGEDPEMEVLVDRPEIVNGIVRVTGAFTVEATIPAPALDDETESAARRVTQGYGQYLARMIEVLRRAPILQLIGGKTVEFRNLHPPARALELHAIAEVRNGKDGIETKQVAVVFGPENGAVTQQLIHRAAQEANVKNYAHLYVIGFAIQDAATKQLRNAEDFYGMPVTYVQATMDILMGDLLKTTRSSQVFSVTGLPDVEFVKLKRKNAEGDALVQVRLLAVDTFDPVTMEPSTVKGEDVPCWMIDSDYDELCFRANQVFFPRTGAWENLKRALKGSFAESLWDHLAGTESEPFVAGEHKRIAVKVIDERGNELLVVKDLKEAKDE